MASEPRGERDHPSGGAELDAAVEAFADAFADRDLLGEIEERISSSLVRDLGAGSTLGDFTFTRRLGAGGMGVVFEGRQRSVSGRRVAVKVLRSLFDSERTAARFQREIATVSELDHPAIVPVITAGVADGVPYYAMKYVEGISMSRLLVELATDVGAPVDTNAVREVLQRRAPAPGEESSSPSDDYGSAWEQPYHRWAARLAFHVAEALQHAHEHGVVHRDVKPANVMVTPRGRPVLLDFGLASQDEAPTLTESGAFLGTLAYASPEQVRGDTVDTRTDVYSLGATLYELLSLRRPFEAASRSDLMRRVELEEPPPLEEAIPLDLRTICSCAMSKSPGRRYATPGAMAQDLRRFLAGEPLHARPPGPIARTARWGRRHPRLVAGALVVAATLGALRARDHVRAASHFEEAAGAFEEYRAGQRELDALEDELRHLASWRGDVHRAADYDRMDAVRSRAAAQLATVTADLSRTERALRAAAEHLGRSSTVRRRIAELYATELSNKLRDYDDLYDPDGIAALGEQVRANGGGERYAALLDTRGRVTLTTEPAGARVDIRASRGPAGLVASGEAPIELVLPEGSYVAELSFEGRERVRLPFVVRRDACYSDADALPPRELTVTLPELGSIDDGFLYVPAGWTLVEDDPPRWSFVESFLIQRLEVTYGDWIRWMNVLEGQRPEHARLSGRPLEAYAPRYPGDDDTPHTVRGPSGRWMLREGGEHVLDHPVRGVPRMQMIELVSELHRIQSAHPGTYASLPTIDEWLRAARGGDCRRFPWGDEADTTRCASYFARDDSERGSSPGLFEVGTHPGDRSPFGVLDMAGSIAEATLDHFAQAPDELATCGGSYRSQTVDDVGVLAIESHLNERRLHLGFRLVQRFVPEHLRPGPVVRAAPFHDDFERPDGPDVGNCWIEAIGRTPLDRRADPNMTERCSLEGGALVCEGGIGDSSDGMSAWHPIDVTSDGCVITATIVGTCRWPREQRPRSYGLELRSTFIGLPRAQFGACFVDYGRGSAPYFPPGTELRFELTLRDGTLEGRVWPTDARRPGEPQFVKAWPMDSPPPRFVGVHSPNYVGARVEVRDLSVVPFR